MTEQVLLIHGMWCDGSSWGKFADELRAQGFEVHTPSLPEHGPAASAHALGELGIDDYAAMWCGAARASFARPDGLSYFFLPASKSRSSRRVAA